MLDDVGLIPALERLAQDVTRRGDTVVELVPDDLSEERLPSAVETVVYRVVQEALTNVLRHARATTASITVIVTRRLARALVEDDGIGFDPDGAEMPGHLGVKGMAERADLVGRTVQVSSTPGRGTTVLLEVPLA